MPVAHGPSWMQYAFIPNKINLLVTNAHNRVRRPCKRWDTPKELRQRGTVIPSAKQRLKRMLVGIESSQCLDPQQRGKNQGLKATQQGLIAVMHQGKVVVRMGELMRFDRLLEAGHHRRKALLLVKPMGKEMHA